MQNYWDEAEMNKLRELWLAGVLKAEIARQLPGRSIAAVDDKRKAMGLPPRPPQHPAHRRAPQKAVPMLALNVLAFREPMAKPPEKPKFVAMPIAYAKTCQWIEGDPRKDGGPCFCNGPVYRESWCLTHWDRVHGYLDAAD